MRPQIRSHQKRQRPSPKTDIVATEDNVTAGNPHATFDERGVETELGPNQ